MLERFISIGHPLSYTVDPNFCRNPHGHQLSVVLDENEGGTAEHLRRAISVKYQISCICSENSLSQFVRTRKKKKKDIKIQIHSPEL